MNRETKQQNKTKHNYIPYNKELKEKARLLRNSPTASEKKLWYEYLREHKYKFLRQKPIGNYIVDFYCSSLKLVIELDGDTHIDKKDILYDKQRTNFLKSFGLQVIKFWNYDVLSGAGAVEEMIEDKINRIENEI